MKPKPATSSPPRTKTASIHPEQVFADLLANVLLLGPVTDCFTIQPSEIEFVTVGSIEVVTPPSVGYGIRTFSTRPVGLL